MIVVTNLLILNVFLRVSTVTAQENPCEMEVYAYNALAACTNTSSPAVARALITADGQCRSVLSTASVSPTTDAAAYQLLPGNYRAECVNSTAVRFVESACSFAQCNSTSLLTDATCDRNNDIAASLYSRLEPPVYTTYPNRNAAFICIQANGSDQTVSFVIFGNCSSPSCRVPTPSPIVAPTAPSTTPPTTVPPGTAVTNAPIPTTIVVTTTPPSTPTLPTETPTNVPNENPTSLPPNNELDDDDDEDAPTTGRPPTTPPVVAPNTNDNNGEGMAPSSPSSPNENVTTPINNNNSSSDSNNSSSSSAGMSTLIAGVASGIAFVAVLLAVGLLVRRKQQQKHRDMTHDDDYNNNGSKYSHSQNYNHNKNGPDGFGDHSHQSPTDPNHRPVGAGAPYHHNNNNFSSTPDDSTAQQYAATTNEIWVDPNADEVSTLGGGTLPNEFVFGQDEPTASVNMDYDFNRNQYRVPDAEERTQSQFTTASNPTTFTNFSKLGLLGQQADFDADDHSFEEQFAELDHDIRSTKYDTTTTQQQQQPNNANYQDHPDISNRVKPFEVRAPPGKLGMVVDTPNGGVPVVRAIKPDSVLNGSVKVGDRLISVDHVNVTSMSALEVSNLISLKQHQQRLLIFCRLTPS